MLKGIFIFIGLLLLPPAVSARSGVSEACLGDTLCQKPLLLHFRFDRSLLEYDYMNNPRTLQRFGSLFADSLEVSRIDTVTITSYASPEGDNFYNSRLAHRRAIAVKGYLLWKYPHLDQYRILIRPRGEDWTGLRQLVEADAAIPNRDDVLKILDTVTDTERCKALLRRLNGGYVYSYITRNLLPQLRNAAVCVLKMKERNSLLRQAPDGCPRQPANSLLSLLPASAAEAQLAFARPHRAAFLPGAPRAGHPLLALKTNLLTWAGITARGKVASFRPNLALELFFARRWSLSASGQYSHWQGGKGNKFWGISGYSLEPRLWLSAPGTYRWLFLGAYGQLGDFDHQPHPDGDTGRTGASLTGTYWSAGLSLGLYLRLSRQWGLEAGLRAGYRDATGKAYDNEPPHTYYNHDFSSARWGVTGLNFSLTYRWWSKTER